MATTAWLMLRISRAQASACWCSNAVTCSAARPSPKRFFPAFNSQSARTSFPCCGPEIIRELDLPRHGLEILPLDGTFTPMPSGDYLWRVNDHAKTRMEIARHSRLDAEAYDEYGKAMIEMAHFVKPIMNMTPPDPASLNPKGLMDLLTMGRRFQRLSSDDKYNQVS